MGKFKLSRMFYKRLQWNKRNYNVKPHLQGFFNSLKAYNVRFNGTRLSNYTRESSQFL